MVPMRDGVHVCVDIYRPDAPGKFPAILAFAVHNKDLQTPDIAEAIPPQPAWSPYGRVAWKQGTQNTLCQRLYAHYW